MSRNQLRDHCKAFKKSPNLLSSKYTAQEVGCSREVCWSPSFCQSDRNDIMGLTCRVAFGSKPWHPARSPCELFSGLSRVSCKLSLRGSVLFGRGSRLRLRQIASAVRFLNFWSLSWSKETSSFRGRHATEARASFCLHIRGHPPKWAREIDKLPTPKYQEYTRGIFKFPHIWTRELCHEG